MAGKSMHRHSSQPHHSATPRVRLVRVADVKVAPDRRPPRKAQEIAESIETLGRLLNPITVNTDLRLIAGANRLEAYKLLGRECIPAIVLSIDDVDAELAELDENLMRDELTAYQHALCVARRKKLYEARYPEAQRVGRPPRALASTIACAIGGDVKL